MRTWTIGTTLVAVFLIGGAGIGFAAEDAAAPESEAPAEFTATDVILALGEHIGGLQHFQLEVVDSIDEVSANGQKVQYSHVRTALVSRPDRLVLTSRGDQENRKLIKSKESVTLMDTEDGVYARIPYTGTIDEMMDRLLLDQYGVTVPLADFLGGDPATEMLEGAYEEAYLGLHLAGTNLCHHVAFRHADIDWQAWVDAGDTPKLRKLVIAYKHEAGVPQYAVHLKSIEPLEASPADDAFAPPIPKDFEEIEMLPAEGGGTQ